jgi:hypothetical protein
MISWNIPIFPIGLFPFTLKGQRKAHLSAIWEIAAESRSFSFMFKVAESA